MYCFVVGHDVQICNDFKCPVRPCTDKRAIAFLRDSTNLTLDQAKKEHRNILKGVLNHKIVFVVSELKIDLKYRDGKWYIDIQDL